MLITESMKQMYKKKAKENKKKFIQEIPITVYMHYITTPLLSQTECTSKNVVIASCCMV